MKINLENLSISRTPIETGEFNQIEMLPSTSGQKLHDDKKQKKKYQEYKRNQEKEQATIKTEFQNETPEKSSTFVDTKDFPELKKPGKQKKKLMFQTNMCTSPFKGDSPVLPIVPTGKGKKLNSQFPASVSTDNINKEVSPKKDNSMLQAVAENDVNVPSNMLEVKNELNPNSQENKDDLQKILLQPHRNPNKKKRSEPVFINFHDILVKNRKQKKAARAERWRQKMLGSRVRSHQNRDKLYGNYLDSSNPIRKRGKHRQIQKKKLSNLKLAIIKERIIKSKIKEQTVAAQFGSSSINLLDEIDFKTEIKIYLQELNEKRCRNLGRKNVKINENINAVKSEKDIDDNMITNLVQKKEENLGNVSPVKKKTIPNVTASGQIKFTSKFREYCNNMITPDLNSAVVKLIEELIKLQDRLFSRDPVKAKAKKRHISGIREVKKYLGLKKVKMIIIAPNLEKLQMEGSLYDSVNELKSMADSQKVPYGFALDRFRLGRCTKKNVPVSAFAILNYDGVEDLYEAAVHQLLEAKRNFLELAKPKIPENTEDVNSKVLSALVSAFKEVQVKNDLQSAVN